jgi:hypothetical protein
VLQTNFNYNDLLLVLDSAPDSYRKNAEGSVVAILIGDDRPDKMRSTASPVYTIEYEDGFAQDVEERYLTLSIRYTGDMLP